MKRWWLVILLLGLFGASFGHDLALVRILIVQGKSFRVTAPLSKLIRLSHLPLDSGPIEIDQAVRSRIKTNAKFDKADLKIDSQNDILRWESNLTASQTNCKVTEKFFPEDDLSRTEVESQNPDGSVEKYVIGEESKPIFLTFLILGVEHILSGLDHILFIIGLLLLGSTWKELLKTVTAFTLAHCITLTLAALNIFRADPRWIEPLIALSIVAVAIENLRKPDEKHQLRLPIAFAFGLIHGFGFAGAMTKVDLTGWSLAEGLLSFNVGVEFGQAAILLVGCALTALIAAKFKEKLPTIQYIGSTAVGIVGSYWFIQRLFGF